MFRLILSEDPPLSYKTLRDHAFTVTGGSVKKSQPGVHVQQPEVGRFGFDPAPTATSPLFCPRP